MSNMKSNVSSILSKPNYLSYDTLIL